MWSRSKIARVLLDSLCLTLVLYIITTLPSLYTSPGHIYRLEKEGGWWWWAYAEADIYYDDNTYKIRVSDSRVNAGAGAYSPIAWGIYTLYKHLNSDWADAYVHAWFHNTITGDKWNSYAYVYVDPPYHYGYHGSY